MQTGIDETERAMASLTTNLLCAYAECAARVTTFLYLREVHGAGESFDSFLNILDQVLAPLFEEAETLREDLPAMVGLAESTINESVVQAIAMARLLVFNEFASTAH